MSCAFSFLQSKEAKRSKSLVIHIFLPFKKPKKPWSIHISFFNVRKQNHGAMSYANSFLQSEEAKRRKPLVK